MFFEDSSSMTEMNKKTIICIVDCYYYTYCDWKLIIDWDLKLWGILTRKRKQKSLVVNKPLYW